MKKFNAFLVSLLATAALNAAVIDQVIVRQQWPWSTDIKVEYRLLEVDAAHPVDLAVKAYNGDVELTLPEAAIKGDRYGISDGVGTLVIDPVAAFGTAKVALANFKVKLTVTDSPANINEVIYKIVCLTNGVVTDVTRSDIKNGLYGSYVTDYGQLGDGFTAPLLSEWGEETLVWTGVAADNKYKTTHMVFRKIPAAGKTFTMGNASDPTVSRPAKLTKDYWMGVFEVTRGQMFAAGAGTAEAVASSCVPANNLYFEDFIGWSYRWVPSSNDSYGGLVGKIRTMTTNAGALLDVSVPSAAQWEFAARGGTATGLPTGKTYETDAAKKVDIKLIGECYASEAVDVGQFKPNAFGLYDTVGNVSELECDYYVSDAVRTTNYETEQDLEDPLGPKSHTGQISCGGQAYFVNGADPGSVNVWYRYPLYNANGGPDGSHYALAKWVGCRLMIRE